MDNLSNPSTELREANRSEVLLLLQRGNNLSRAEIGVHTRMTPAGVSRIVRELLDRNLIREGVLDGPKRLGRKSSALQINPEGAHVLGVALTANLQSVGLVDATGEVVQERKLSLPGGLVPAAVVRSIARQVKHLTRSRPVLGLGVAIATNYAIAEDGIVSSRFLEWDHVPLKKMLEDAISLPVALTTRAASLVQAEIARAPLEQPNDFFLINGGVGLGSAWVQDGIVKTEGQGFGSLNHLQHPNASARCQCGKVGCLERTASGLAVVLDLHPGRVNQGDSYYQLAPVLSEIHALASRGDKTAQHAYYRAGTRLAHGIDLVQTLLAPSRILLAGETGQQADFVAGVRAGLASLTPSVHIDNCEVSSIEGASAVALERFFFSPNKSLSYLDAA